MNKFAFTCLLLFTLPLMGQVVTAEDSARDVLQYNESFVERDAPTTDITVMTEIPVYPWTSLMAEFGGTFSLFFGLSLISVWDGMEKLAKIMRYYQM